MTDLIHGEKVAFEPFGTLAGMLAGQPFKIFPQGTYYRGERKLELTPDRLREFADNVKAGRPQYRIPINLNHNHESGKVGSIDEVEYLPDAKDGPGLYATKFEFSERGQKAVRDDGYDQISGEAVWSLLDGAKWQDPKTGSYHDNVLVGTALTPTGYFGRDVALFSATPPETMTGPTMQESTTPVAAKRGNGYTKLRAMMKSKFDELMAMVKDDDGDGEMDMPADEKHEGMSAAIPVAGAAEPAAKAANDQGVTTMADEKMVETFSAEEFAAYKVQAEAEKKELAEKFAALELRSRGVERARRHDQLLARAERFVAIPVAALELADKFQALEEKDAELYKWVDGLLETLDKQIAQADLFGQKASARTGGQVEKFDGVVAKIHADKFGGDPAKYAEAMDEAARLHPALYTEYASTYSTRRKGE